MDTWSIQKQTIVTEVAKIRTRINYMRHVTYRISAPQVVNRLEERYELYASLNSLNQLIDAFKLRLTELEEDFDEMCAVNDELEKLQNTNTKALVPTDLNERSLELVKDFKEFRTEMVESVDASSEILNCFIEETSY